MDKKNRRISLPKYVSIHPDVLAMAERLSARFHVNFSQLVTRLVVEANAKIFGGESPKNPQITKPALSEVDPLS